MQIAVKVGKVVDPRPHEVLGEEHGQVGGLNPREGFLEDSEAPVFTLDRRRVGK